MKAVVQRVTRCRITADGTDRGEIGKGLLVYLGIERGDDRSDVEYLQRKIIGLRVFNDVNGVMNMDLREVHGSLAVVSQFTLLADTRKGKRPSYHLSADPETAESLYEGFLESIRQNNITVISGIFGAYMQIDYVNDGPVTIPVDSRDRNRPRKQKS